MALKRSWYPLRALVSPEFACQNAPSAPDLELPGLLEGQLGLGEGRNVP